MAYDYQSAISAGASPSDVVSYLAKQTGYNAQGAIAAGANQNDVLSYMANLPSAGENAGTASEGNSTGLTEQQSTSGLKQIGNFLFPIVGDIANDVTGKNNKTFLQQVGDTALSALPFVPGLGEAGDVARAGGAALEGAADVGTDAVAEGSADAAGGTGNATASGAPVTPPPAQPQSIFDKITSNPIARGTVLSYGTGVAQSLSQGQSIPQAFRPNVNTISSTLLGGGTSAATEAFGALRNNIAGISTPVLNEFKNMSLENDPANLDLMNAYNSAAEAHASNVRTPSVENVAAAKLDTAASQIEANTKSAGAAVGAAKQASGHLPLGDVTPIATNFANEVDQRYGYQITSNDDGSVNLTRSPGRMVDVAPEDMARIKNTAQQLNQLGSGATAGQAMDVIGNIDNGITAAKNAVGATVSPIDGLMAKTRSALDGVLRDAAPDLAQANDRFSQLKDLTRQVNDIAGNKLQRGEMLMQRVFGNKSEDSLKLFQAIKDETGVDLTKHAVFAKNAIDNYGSKADQSALQNILGEAYKGSGNPIISGIIGAAKGVAKNTFANPDTIAKDALLGRTSLFPSLIKKGAIELSRTPGMGS